MARILLKDGKVQEQRVYINQQGFANRLGLTFPAIIGQFPELLWGKLRANL